MSIRTGRNRARPMFQTPSLRSAIFRCAILAAALVFLVARPGVAASADVTAVLSNSNTAVDQAVQLQIQVKGDRNAAPPSEISVDGLEIHSTGQMQSFEMRNFDVSSSVTFNYTILPLRAGRSASGSRAESRGVHTRLDFPQTDPAWARHITLQRPPMGTESEPSDSGDSPQRHKGHKDSHKVKNQ